MGIDVQFHRQGDRQIRGGVREARNRKSLRVDPARIPFERKRLRYAPDHIRWAGNWPGRPTARTAAADPKSAAGLRLPAACGRLQ